MIQSTHINFWAVIVAALAQMVVGFIWFSPALFFRPWLKANGMETPPKPQAWIFALMLALTLISTTALAAIVRRIGITNAFGGVLLALFLWTATLMPFIAGTTLATGKKFNL